MDGQVAVAFDHKQYEEALEPSLDERVQAYNAAIQRASKLCPFATEPVSCVQWVPADQVTANDYNPNTVAPPEMQLLEHSIAQDGYTQPIVTWQTGDAEYEVVDGFHRNRVGRESAVVSERIQGYLPIVVVNDTRIDRGDRIAATIRHNRARGKHTVEGMSEIVLELKRRNWSDKKIGKELGMDSDEVLRLAQITGLSEMFADREFSIAWEADMETTINEDDDLIDVDLSTVPDVVVGWEDRTESKSQKRDGTGAFLARINEQGDKWNWAAYTVPMQEGTAGSREEAKEAADACFAT